MGNKKAAGGSVTLVKPGGDEGDRTPDLGIANAALSQLSYIPGKQYYRLKSRRRSIELDKAGLFRPSDGLKSRMSR